MNKPNLYVFNPTCELAVANGSFSYMPPLLLQDMERDLSILPFIFADPTDFVLTEYPPSDEFKQSLTDAGFELPVFCTHSELAIRSETGINALYPWGWSPAAHFMLKKFRERCSDDFKNSPVYEWQPKHKVLFERETSLNLLLDILNKNQANWLVDREKTGIKVYGIMEIENILKIHRIIVLKAPLSSSGRGIQIIRKDELNNSNRQWISGVIKQQKYLIAEPYLDKRMDFSFQFKILNDDLEYLGYSIFETNSNGQYKGTFIRPDLNHFFPKEEICALSERIEKTALLIEKSLKKSDYAKFHRGFLGVDALIFNDHEELKIQPCIEVNCRMNMGILGMFLERIIHQESIGIFTLYTGNPGEFKKFALEQSKIKPIRFKEGKICSGFIPLTEPDSKKRFGAYSVLEFAR
ncbi:MAG: hypothetical protein WAO52_05435 [Prolixibacteraceae bacterium]